MTFPFGASSNGGANKGSDLETIQTEALGFLSIAGDAKVRLTSPWSDLPAATSSLLSIASKKGLVAAAGPDQIILATTESIRKTFESSKDGDSDIRSFQPQLKLPMSMRISQLSFTADENYLVLSAESGGGLAVYDVQSLLQGSSSSAFELSTNGEGLRALVPNPTAEKAELVAIVTNGGHLHMANLRDQSISNALKSQVSCISWSSKGKQLCVGLGDGTIHQMTPEGEGKAEIPGPPGEGNCHVSSLTWLENNLFLAIHTTADSPPRSLYHIITRQNPTTFDYQLLTDPIEPFGSEKSPHHTLLRLRDFPPDLQDLLIVTSTVSTEVGLLTRSKSPLANDKPADSITKVFTTTELLDDTKRPTLPMTDSMDDSTAIGIALDLSAKDKVYKPIPSDDELEESPGPLPGFWILTHEGVLCSWWLVYTDSIKQGTSYPGLVALQASSVEPAPAAAPSTAGAFSSSLAGPSPFASSTSAGPAFGSSTHLGQQSSPWATAGATGGPSTNGGVAFGSSSFGASALASSTAPAFGKSTFGQSLQLGARASPWASSGGAASSTPAFGQSAFSSFADKGGQSPFGASISSQAAGAAPASGGFAGFASQGGFASLATGGSVLNSGDKPAGTSVFGSASASDSVFGTPQGQSQQSVFGTPQGKPAGSVFGSTPFKLQSSFKPDPPAQDDVAKSPGPSGSSMFGSAFGSSLGETSTKNIFATPSKDDDMDTTEAVEETPKQKPSFPPQAQSPESTTPTTTPAISRFGNLASPPPGPLSGQASKSSASGLFGNFKKETSQSAAATTNLFGSPREPAESVGEARPADKAAAAISKDAFIKNISSPSASPDKSTVSRIFGSTTPGPTLDSALMGTTKAKKSVSIVEPIASPHHEAEASAPEEASKPLDFVKVSNATESKAIENAPKATMAKVLAKPDTPSSPPNSTSKEIPSIFSTAPTATAPSSFSFPSASSTQPFDDGESDLEEDNSSEGSGVDVAKDLGASITGMTPGYAPQSAFGRFGGLGGPSAATLSPQQRPRTLFGEVSRGSPAMVPHPGADASAVRSLSPRGVGSATANRVMQADTSRSASIPSMASQLLGPPTSKAQGSASTEDAFIAQQRKLKERQDAEEDQLLVDEEDDEVQRVLESEIEPTLALDEFIAHSNVAPPAKDSVPAQVEAVYRDINSMIDTLGLNARAVTAFTQGHLGNRASYGRSKDDLENPDDWVLCEIGDLGEVLESELPADLEYGRVRDVAGKSDACQDLARDLQRLRAKQEDLKRVITAKTDPTQADVARALPLSVEQATQQNELRREYTNFSKALAEAEEALTLLKTRIASVSSSAGRGPSSVPTVEAVMRTIAKMTSMVEKRSGDVDVLETQLRRMRLDSESREESPMRTPLRRSMMMTGESPFSRSRQSLSASVMSLGGGSVKGGTPRKKVSGFSREEKGGLMDKRAKRQAVLARLKEGVEKKGINVWTMEDME